MMYGAQHQQNAVKSGYWPLFRYNPMKPRGERLSLDSKDAVLPLKDFMYDETRFSILERQNPEAAGIMLAGAEDGVHEHWARLLALKAL